jgi:hypothetical protein
MEIFWLVVGAIILFTAGVETGRKEGADKANKRWNDWLDETDFSRGDARMIRATAPSEGRRRGNLWVG